MDMGRYVIRLITGRLVAIRPEKKNLPHVLIIARCKAMLIAPLTGPAFRRKATPNEKILSN